MNVVRMKCGPHGLRIRFMDSLLGVRHKFIGSGSDRSVRSRRVPARSHRPAGRPAALRRRRVRRRQQALPGGESFRLRGGKDSTLRTGLFRRSGRGISRRFRVDHIVFMDDDRQRRRGRCLRSRVGSRSTGPAPGFSDTCPVERTETPAPNEGEARFEQRYDEHRVREFSSAGACRASICVR